MDNQQGRIHVQYHGNHPQNNDYFDWDDEVPSGMLTGSITATAIAENSAGTSAKTALEEFEEFNLDDCEELTEEEKELLLLYIQNNQGSVVFTDVNDEDDMQHTEPPPDYGDYYSGRYLETIYEEDSDDLRSWDSDEIDDILIPSPTSDVDATVSTIKKKGKEPDKDSSYDSDFSFVNSTECLDSDSHREKADNNKIASDTGLSSDDEINIALYNEGDIQDVLDQVDVPVSANNSHEMILNSAGNGLCLLNQTYVLNDSIISSDDAIDYSKSSENTDLLVGLNKSGDALEEWQKTSVGKSQVNSHESTITQVKDEAVLPSMDDYFKLQVNHPNRSTKTNLGDLNMQNCLQGQTYDSGKVNKLCDFNERDNKMNESNAPELDLSRSASEELYSMLPKVSDDLPEIKEICDSWFTKSPAISDAQAKSIVYKRDDGKIGEMCQKDDWEQWLVHSLDEKSGRHVTSGGIYLTDHEQLNLPTSDVAERNNQVFSDDDVLINAHYTTHTLCSDEALDLSVKRGRSLPRNYQSPTEAFHCFDHDFTSRGQRVKCLRGNSLTDISLTSVGVSRDTQQHICGSDLLQRSKSTPDLSTKGGKREETLVKKIEHTSQVKLEVCELSPGLQYKKHCVIVNESVSVKKAKFEALLNSPDSPSRKQEVDKSEKVANPPVISEGNSTPEICDARVNVIHHHTTSEHPIRVLSFSSSEEEGEDGEEIEPCDTTYDAQMPHSRVSQQYLLSADSASPSNGMRKDNITRETAINGSARVVDCNNAMSAQPRQKTDVGKLVAMFENEIKKSEPRRSTATLVIRGGDRYQNNVTSSPLVDVTPEHFNKITGLESGIRATAQKPPLPPLQQSHISFNSLPETTPRTLRYVNARKHFLNTASNQETSINGESENDYDNEPKLVRLTSDRLSTFQRRAQEDRARLAKSVPDLVSAPDKVFSEVKLAKKPDRPSPSKALIDKNRELAAKRRLELSKSRNEDEWDKLLSAAAAHYGKRYENAKQKMSSAKKLNDKLSKSQGYLETDIDTLECYEVDQTNIDDVFSSSVAASSGGRSRAKSLMSLGAKHEDSTVSSEGGSVDGSRAKSMEFLLDDENKAATLPPENKLMYDGKVPSEHELRFQKSLKNLTLPSWYRDTNTSIISKSKGENLNDAESNTSTTRWQGLGSRSSSSSSLSGAKPTCTTKPVVVPKRVTADWRYIKYGISSSKESLTPQSPSTGPDSPTEEHSFSYHPSLSRWNTARMSNTSASSFGGGSAYRSFRQPYLGWRSSAERLSFNSGHPSNASSQCPSPSSSAISAASNSFAFRPDRMNFGSGLSKWGNLGAMNLSYNTDTESEFEYSRPSSALAGGQLHLSSWRPSTVENQQVDKQTEIVKSSVGEVSSEPRVNGHCDSEDLSGTKHVWMESSFVGKKNELKAQEVTEKISSDCSQYETIVQTDTLQSSERPQGEYYAMLRNQHKNLVCT